MHNRLPARIAIAIAAVLTAGASATGVAQARPAAPLTPVIVTLHPTAADPAVVAAEQLRPFGISAGALFRHALRGYAASVPAAALGALRSDLRVAAVEQDGPMHLVTTQTGATWGLDRIDQRARPLSGTYSYTATGAGVNAYIIDTGIRRSHREFGGRAVSGIDLYDGGEVDDCNGHGSHVAGTVGGSTYGVAKQVTLIGVRVFGCGSSTTTSMIISGID